MNDVQKANKGRKNSKISRIKNFDQFIGKCTLENLKILGEQLQLYSQPQNVTKFSEPLKDLIQLLFKYLMDNNQNLEEDVIGAFREEKIFEGIKKIYYQENYDINCTIIQSLSILIVNIVKSKSYLYFMLSNNFINDLLLIDYSKYDDEYYSYYVNFIKSLAMRLDENTFLLFYNQRSCLFPLLDCSLNLYNYSNAMIRTVVNNIVLQILKSNIDEVQKLFTDLPSVNYFSFISLRMKDLINDLCGNISNYDPYEDLIDLSLFVNDLLTLNKSKINFMVRNAIFYYFLLPGIFQFLHSYFYGRSFIIENDENIPNNTKESIIMLCLITFLINIRDETIRYILLQLLLSEYIPENLDKFIINTPEGNPFYSYKWDKDFQKKITFSKFISMNYSIEFLGSFINQDNYHFKDIERTESNRVREMKNIKSKCEEINMRTKIVAEKQENIIYEMSQFIFDIFNEKADEFGKMKDYHHNLGKGLGIKIGVINKMFQNPKIINKNNFPTGKDCIHDGIEYITGEIMKDCFMWEYKLWMENIDDPKKIKLKPNIFRIILFNLLNNENNVNVNIPLVIINNYFIWTIIHKITMSKKIMDHFYLNISSSSENNNVNDTPTPSQISEEQNQKLNEEDILYNKFVFDEKYITQKLKKKENVDYKTNDVLIEKLCLNLENKILLSKIELTYIELICRNINSLFIDNSPNKEKEQTTIKNTLINLIKLLKDSLKLPENGSKEQNSSFEEFLVTTLQKVLNIYYDNSHFNKKLDNLPNILEIIAEYETNKNLNKGNIVNNLSLSIVYLIIVLARFNKDNKNKNPFKGLYKKRKYNIKEILEEKDCNNNNIYKILYKQESQIFIYDDLFIYYFNLTDGKENDVEVNDIIFIKNSIAKKGKKNGKPIFFINEKLINFNNDEEGEKEFQNIQDKYVEVKNNIKNNFPKEYNRFTLDNILKYVEEL